MDDEGCLGTGDELGTAVGGFDRAAGRFEAQVDQVPWTQQAHVDRRPLVPGVLLALAHAAPSLRAEARPGVRLVIAAASDHVMRLAVEPRIKGSALGYERDRRPVRKARWGRSDQLETLQVPLERISAERSPGPFFSAAAASWLPIADAYS